MCVVRVPGGAVDAGNAWSDAATASVWIPKKAKSYFIGLFLLPFDRLMVYDNIDIILLYYHHRETRVFRKSGSRGMIPLAEREAEPRRER